MIKLNFMSRIRDLFKSKKEETFEDAPLVKSDVYNKENSDCAVENFEGVLNYICSDVKRSIRLTSTMKDELKEIFGKQLTTVFNGEFKFWLWVFNFEGEVFRVYTANVKGTCISIEANYGEDKGKVCRHFLHMLDKKLKEYEEE